MAQQGSHSLVLAAMFVVLLGSSLANAEMVLFQDYSFERTEDVQFGDPEWFVGFGGTSVLQRFNSDANVFFGSHNVTNKMISGTVRTPGSLDDDAFGIVLGWQSGNFSNLGAEWILIDWKGDTQTFNWDAGEGSRSNATAGTEMLEGLAVSRVSGIPSADELWGHVNEPFDPEAMTGNADGGVEELARGAVNGTTNWEVSPAPEYAFKILYEPNRLRVFVDGTLEADLAGSFPDGVLGFYTAANQQTVFENWDVSAIPEPSGGILAMIGLAVTGFIRRRRAG